MTGDCPRRIFTERLPNVVQPYARRTTRLAHVQQHIGLLLGGAAGTRVCQTLGIPTGVDALLALVRQRCLPAVPTPRVLGIDDWAQRKGHRYGTILVDHERGRIVDLLPDRTPESVRQWLHDHPGVEIVTRDRAEAYAQGITEGAPTALQVADRWHLLKNVTDALALVLQHQHTVVRTHLEAHGLVGTAPPVGPPANSMPERDELPQANQGAGEITPLSVADQPRYARALEARQLHARGWLQKDIARHLACHPKTVRRDLAQMLPLTARSGARTSILDPYKPYLLERWNAGCHNASQLLREIQPLGYHGGATTVGSFVVTLRRHSGLPGRRSARDRAVGAPLPAATIARLPAPRQLAWLCTQPVSVLDADQRAMRAALGTVSGTVATAVTLAQSFATMVRDRQAGTLEAWLASASRCGIAAFRSLANGLRADHAAVAAALTVEWSNGRTEGNVNRLKCVKRQMYGRGKLDLLRVRLLAT